MIGMRIIKSSITFNPAILLFAMLLVFAPLTMSFGQNIAERVDRINAIKQVDESIVINSVRCQAESSRNVSDGSVSIVIDDANSKESLYSVIYELHVKENYQIAEGLQATNNVITINNAANGDYVSFQVIREDNLKASLPYESSEAVKRADLVNIDGSAARGQCSGMLSDCKGTIVTYSSLESEFYYNTSSGFRPCGFYLNSDCSITEQCRWHCIDGDLATPTPFTAHTYVETGYEDVNLTALQAARINWVICNYEIDNDAAGISAAIWYLAGTGGSSNAVVVQAENAITAPDGSENLMTFYKPTVENIQNMVKWECQKFCPLTVDAGNDRSICAGENITLTAAATSTNTVTYLWSTGETTQSITVSPNTTTTYTVTANDNEGCVATDEVTVNFLTNCLDPENGWMYECGDDKQVDEYGYNANCSSTTTATIPNPENVFQYVVEMIYKNSNPGSTIQFTDASNTVHVLNRSGQIGQSHHQIWAYRGLITGSTSSITYTNSSDTCNLESLMIYVDRNVPNAGAGSGVFANLSGYNDLQTVTIPIPTDDGHRDLVIDAPISEITPSERYFLINASAGGVSDQVILYGPDTSLPGGTCCLAIPTLTLNDVPGNVSEVIITIDTRHHQNGLSVMGQSWTVAGGINVAVECFACELEASIANQTICSGESASLSVNTNGGFAPYAYSWDNGAGTSQSVTVSPESTTTYTAIVTDANGCVDTANAIVTVNPTPIANAGSDEIICKGESTTLTASGGGSYFWTTGSTTPTTTVSPNVTTTFSVTVTNNDGCEDTDYVKVTVNSVPTVDAGDDESICEGESITLTATSDYPGTIMYLWNTGATTASITVSPNSTTTYTVTAMSDKACSDSDEVTINVNPAPVANAGVDQTICDGESAQLSASVNSGTAPYSYVWNGLGDGVIKTVNPSTTTTYTVTITDANGCVDTDDVTINVNPAPVANAGVDQTICDGESAQLSASVSSGTAPYSYVWNGLGDGVTKTVSPSTTTTYTVTITDANGCVDTDDVTINVNPTLVANAGVDQTICDGESAQLSAIVSSGTAPYSYVWNGLGDGVTKTVSPSTTTTYTVTITDANGCVDTDDVTINVNPTPVANAGVDQTICDGESAQLSASVSNGTAPYSYVWNGLGDGVTKTVSPSTTTTYTVTITDANGCVDTDDVIVIVNDIPTVDAGDDKTICIGEFIEIGGAVDPTVILYQWSTSAGNIIGANAPSLDVNPMVTTIYTISGYNQFGCQAVDSVTVEVNSVPPTPESLQRVFACEGMPLPTLVVFVEPGNTANWYDAPINGNLLAEGTLTYQPNQVGTFYVEQVIPRNECSSIERFEIEVIHIEGCDDCSTPACLEMTIQRN